MGATHALALDECRKQLSFAVDDVAANRKLLANTDWRAGSRSAAAQVGNDLQRVTDILGTSSLAASSDHRQAIGEALSTLGGAEGRVEYEESQLTG